MLTPPSGAANANYRVFNADGSEVEQCGNGVRCLARFIADHDDFDGTEVLLSGSAGKVTASLKDGNRVQVNMGEPDFSPAALPFKADEPADHYPLALKAQTLQIGVVSMGNPHAVLEWAALDEAPLDALGAEISQHPRFPQQTNVEFMRVVDARHIRLRVFERGVGETRACGTGACAAMAVARRWGILEDTIEVALPGGILQITWSGPGASLYMTGPAEDVFGGYIDL